MLATSLARDLYRDWYGEEPPPVLPWRIDAIPHTGNPTLPLYTVDRDAWRVTLNLHEGQMRAWESDSLYTFMLAGAQGGKTAFLPWVLARKRTGGHGRGQRRRRLPDRHVHVATVQFRLPPCDIGHVSVCAGDSPVLAVNRVF